MSSTKFHNVRHEKELEGGNSKTTSIADSTDKSDLNKYVKETQMIKVLAKKGISKLFPIQYETFNLIYKGQDLVAKDRTGSGKTLAFALPIIIRMREQSKFKGNHQPKFLIVLPTRELALQVKDQINSLRYRDEQDFIVTAIYGGNGMQEQLQAVGRGVDILVATPGRLIDFLNRGVVKMNALEAICLDQADQMLKIGFKEEIEKIFQFINKAKSTKIQCLLFSATIPEWIWDISNQYQSKSKKFIDMIKDSNVKTSKTVEHYRLKAFPMEKEAYLGSLIKHFFKGKKGKVIIFCETKKQVDRIGNSGLINLQMGILHGDIKQFQREKVFRKFKNSQIDCLIATNVAARGLDFPQIDLIIQMQPPPTTEAYIHRSGRTGRAGKSGICVTLYSHREEHSMKRIQNETNIILHCINSKELKPVTNNQHKNEREQNSYGNRRDRNERSSYKHEQRDYGGDRSRPKQRNDRSNNYDRNDCKSNFSEERKTNNEDFDY